MRVFGDGHFVVEPPAPLGFTSEEVVDHALHDLAIRPGAALNRIFKFLFPPGPAILFAHRRGRFKNLAARGNAAAISGRSSRVSVVMVSWTLTSRLFTFLAPKR